MKRLYRDLSVNYLCNILNKSRQTIYKKMDDNKFSVSDDLLIDNFKKQR
jgi:predicted DNA-binding transcriptional regulator AlpA